MSYLQNSYDNSLMEIERLQRELAARDAELKVLRELRKMVWDFVNIPTLHNEKELGEKAREAAKRKGRT